VSGFSQRYEIFSCQNNKDDVMNMCGRTETKETPYIFNFGIRLRFKCPGMLWALSVGREPLISTGSGGRWVMQLP
jgi:hypothetical protein